MDEKQAVEFDLTDEEALFLDRMLEQLKKEGYQGLTREELIGIIVKATKESGTDIAGIVKKLG